MSRSRFWKQLLLMSATLLVGMASTQGYPWYFALIGLPLGSVFYTFVKGEARWTK